MIDNEAIWIPKHFNAQEVDLQLIYDDVCLNKLFESFMCL